MLLIKKQTGEAKNSLFFFQFVLYQKQPKRFIFLICSSFFISEATETLYFTVFGTTLHVEAQFGGESEIKERCATAQERAPRLLLCSRCEGRATRRCTPARNAATLEVRRQLSSKIINNNLGEHETWVASRVSSPWWSDVAMVSLSVPEPVEVSLGPSSLLETHWFEKRSNETF